MSLKIYKRSTVLRNQMLFVLLSVAFLQVITSLSSGVSSWDAKTFVDLMTRNLFISILGLMSLFLIYNAKNHAKLVFMAFSGLIVFEGVKIFLHDFDKLILILNFLYILLSYYFYLFLKIELDEAVYRPGFRDNGVGPKCEYGLKVDLETSLIKSDGVLSNWGESCCFIAINDEKNIPKGLVKLKINFESKSFEQIGSVVSRYGHGVGITFRNNKEDTLGWNDFYDIISDRGYRPRYLK